MLTLDVWLWFNTHKWAWIVTQQYIALLPWSKILIFITEKPFFNKTRPFMLPKPHKLLISKTKHINMLRGKSLLKKFFNLFDLQHHFWTESRLWNIDQICCQMYANYLNISDHGTALRFDPLWVSYVHNNWICLYMGKYIVQSNHWGYESCIYVISPIRLVPLILCKISNFTTTL